MPGWGRRLQLVGDWTTDRLFARDISELGQVGHPIDRPGPPETGRAEYRRFESPSAG